MKKYLIVLISIIVSCGVKKEASENENIQDGKFSAVFIDINSTKIESDIDPNIPIETRKLSNINLTSRDQFLGDKNNFFMHAIGVIKIPDDGNYFFRLSNSGKVTFKLNNVDLIKDRVIDEKNSYDSSRVLKEGLSFFEMEYYNGDYSPYIVLEWSTDGEDFEVIPTQVFTSIDQATVKPFLVEESNNEPPNTLTKEEVEAGWKLLFDGKVLDGWHSYNTPGTIGSKWKVQDNALFFEGQDKYLQYSIDGIQFYHTGLNFQNKVKLGGGDIVTDDAYENFELKLEWKISQNGNNGIFYTVQEVPELDEAWKSSPEMQVMDNQGHKDGLVYSHRAGDLYDLIASSEVMAKPFGQWNKVKIIKDKGKVEHWLNGKKIVSYDMSGAEWSEMIDNSKFAQYKEWFGRMGPGRIGFQDHDDLVWFRNIKIKEL